MLERIQKIISAAGVTSRRAAEQLITEGRVRVNGQVVTELGTKADANKDHIKVDGKLINPRQPLTYIMLNKPAGFVTTMSDPEGRPTVQDLLKGVKVRVYPVGRLDYNTEGLLLLTNDGDFAHLITHPKHEFPKTYRAKIKGVLEDHQIKTLEDGIYLDDGKTAPAKIKKVSKEEANSWLEITIHEGRKRQVRRMFDRVGHSVIKLKRVRTGNLLLGELPEGAMRYLAPEEVEALKDLAVKDQASVVKSQAPEVRRPAAASSVPARSTTARTGARREDVRPRFGDRGPRPEERRTSGPGRSDRPVSRRQDLAPRVMGQGATGRGPRRPARDVGSKRGQAFAPFSPGARQRSAADENTRRDAGPRRPASGVRNRESATRPPYKPRTQRTAAPFSPVARQRSETNENTPRRLSPGVRNQDAAARPSYKPKTPGTTAARMSGKVFDKSAEFRPKTGTPAASRNVDRKPQRPHQGGKARTPAAHGGSRGPRRSSR